MRTTQHYHLLLNDVEVGILQEVEEGFVREIKQQRAYRSNSVQRLQCGAQSYTLRFERLAVTFCVPAELHGLHNFTLTLIGEERLIRYSGCEFSQLVTKTDGNGTMVQQASICACERSVEEQ